MGYIDYIAIGIVIVLLSFLFWLTILFLKSDTEKRKKIIFKILVAIAIWIIFFTVDYIRTQKQKLPIFCSKLFGLFSYQDGGTVEYIGLGYKVIDFHSLLNGDEYPGAENTLFLERKYICPIYVTYGEAYRNIIYELQNEK